MADLRERVQTFVQANPGSTTTAVRQGVSGSASRIRQALLELKKAGEIANGGNGRGHAWQPTSGTFDPFNVSRQHLPDSAPEALEGIPVATWMTPSAAAKCFDTTPRTIARWESKGFPAWGAGQKKVIPLPHSVWWVIEYGIAKQKKGSGVTRLPLELAVARFNRRQLESGHPSIYIRTRGKA